jgi:O-antigen/teichoic acid export membrane protein
LLRAELQLSRNAIFAIAKFAALILMGLWLPHKSGLAIYATWMVGNIISLVVLAGFVFLKHETRSKKIYQPQWGLLRQWGFAALKHHGFNLALDAPLQALPVLVTIMLSATANAWFYIALSIAGLANVVPSALTMVLYAEGSAQPAMLGYKIRLTLSLAFVASLLAISVLLIGTKLILGIFGHSYAEEAAWCLRILALTSLSGIIRNHYVAICRIQRRIGRAILPLTAVGSLQLLGSALGARLGGLTGMSLGWLIADGICAVFMIPAIYKAAQIDSFIHRMNARRKQCVS